MNFRFILPDLRELDLATPELLACCIWSDVRPVRGAAGLIDWRLLGKLSGLSRDTFLGGAMGEVVYIQGRPKLPFEKILIFGLGLRASFTEETFVTALKHMSKAIEDLHVARAVVELPGRSDAGIAPERAAELLSPTIATDKHDAWWLVEDAEGQRRMGARIEADRRNTRRA